jgi:hypothetical protein
MCDILIKYRNIKVWKKKLPLICMNTVLIYIYYEGVLEGSTALKT